ncbi:MAG TPA: argininosuccinate lyase [Actinomycetota bacterium]|nr:argininosuccinate lyase [Actinomycetota bacterium]
MSADAPLGPGDVPWGGRFATGPHPELVRLTSSLATDVRLLEADVAATKAHARTLVAAGLLEPAQLDALDDACDDVVARAAAGAFADARDEDVHSLVERVLTERLGDAGARIHAGRSRNDLVATDLRLWCRDAAARLASSVADVLDVVARRAEQHRDAVMPGYTHLQRGQPVTLAFHLLAHGFALARDGARFAAAGDAAAAACPLGAGALAGTTLPLDPSLAAAELGFARPFDNAMDAVSERDFACDLVYAAAVCGVHLSRLAEEIVLWTSQEFGFARLPDEWATGSSMMPQKRNPDLAELVRGRAAGGVADVTGLLALLKGLPLAYDRDLQEDKRYVFSAADRVEASLDATRHLLAAVEFDVERLAAATDAGAPWATDVAERLVGRGVPFRDAHRAVGRLVAHLDRAGVDVHDVASELSEIDPRLEPADVPPRDVAARRTPGGPAPEEVARQIRVIRRQSKRLRKRANNPM